MQVTHYRLFITLLLALTLLGGVGAVAQAQEGAPTLRFNEPEIVTLEPNVTVNRAFDALAGDTVEIVLSRLAEFEYTAVLIGPDSAPIGLERQADGNVLVALELAQGGRYTLALQATSGSGQMLIQVNSATPTPLAMGETLANVGDAPLRFSLTPSDPTAPSMLALSTMALREGESLPRLVLTRSSDGEEVLSLNPNMIAELSLRLPAGESFVLSFEPTDVAQQVRIVWSAGEQAPATVGLPDGTGGMGMGSSGSSSGSGACQVYFSGPVNARSGPGTNYAPPVAQVPAGTTLNVSGHNGDRSWYQVNYNGQMVWVAMFVNATEERGNCSGLTVASYPPPPVVAAPPTSPPSSGSGGGPSPAPTSPPSGSGSGSGSGGGGGASPTSPPPPPQPTATPSAPAAPADASSHTFNVSRDGTSQFQEVISYPNGDTEDRIFVRIDLNQSIGNQTRNVTFTLVCSGTGAEYVRWGTNPNSAGLTCGGSTTRFFTYDSDTQYYYVLIPSGSGTAYVNYTLVATASN